MDTITVNQSNLEDFSLDAFFQKMEVIDLAEADDPIGTIEKVYLTDQSLIVVDKSVSKAVHIFTPEGESVAVIKAVGRGPGEFVSLTDATYDPHENRILIYDRAQRKVLFYDLKGHFTHEKKYEPYFLSFEVCGEGKYVLFKYQESHHLTIVDQDFREVAAFLPPVAGKLTITPKPFSTYGKHVSFASLYAPYIYAISGSSPGNGLEPQSKIDYQNDAPESAIWPVTAERSGQVLNQYSVGPTHFAQTQGHVFFTYSNQERGTSYALHDKTTGKTLDHSATYRKDVHLYPVVGATEKAVIVSYQLPDLQSWSAPQQGQLGTQFNQLVTWAKDQPESDQPVLVLYYP